MADNGNTYARGLSGEELALATAKEIWPEYHWLATPPTHPFDLLAYSWSDAPVMAIEVKTVRFEPMAKIAMHKSQIRRKKRWVKDHGRPVPVMVAVDPVTSKIRAREGIKCYEVDKMASIDKIEVMK